jgi:hypothetical protein
MTYTKKNRFSCSKSIISIKVGEKGKAKDSSPHCVGQIVSDVPDELKPHPTQNYKRVLRNGKGCITSMQRQTQG